jgi:hypothetical protein
MARPAWEASTRLEPTALAADSARYRRRLVVTVDGASHGLVTRLHQLADRPGHQLVYSVGWPDFRRS